MKPKGNKRVKRICGKTGCLVNLVKPLRAMLVTTSGNPSPLAKALLLATSVGLWFTIISVGGMAQPIGLLTVVGVIGLVVASSILFMRLLRGIIHRTVRRIVGEEMRKASTGT
jgi:hypothetical protein